MSVEKITTIELPRGDGVRFLDFRGEVLMFPKASTIVVSVIGKGNVMERLVLLTTEDPVFTLNTEVVEGGLDTARVYKVTANIKAEIATSRVTTV